MTVDASRLRSRRGLGSPPSEGARGIEEAVRENPGPALRPDGDKGLSTHLSSAAPDATAAVARRPRLPPPAAEPRIPFTTRVAASTKERLEEACYHLRVKHQAFIDEAIRLHLERHGY